MSKNSNIFCSEIAKTIFGVIFFLLKVIILKKMQKFSICWKEGFTILTCNMKGFFSAEKKNEKCITLGLVKRTKWIINNDKIPWKKVSRNLLSFILCLRCGHNVPYHHKFHQVLMGLKIHILYQMRALALNSAAFPRVGSGAHMRA